MSEFLKPAGQWLSHNVPLTVILVLLILSIFFKIPKKEVNILGWFVGWVGKSFTKVLREDIKSMKEDSNNQIRDLRNDLDTFEHTTNDSIAALQTGTNSNCAMLKIRLDEMEKSNDMQTVRQIKAHVLDFANSCLNHRKHTKRDFDNIIKENEEYETLCKKYSLKNDVYTEDFAYIMKIYHRCQDEDSFLRDNEI